MGTGGECKVNVIYYKLKLIINLSGGLGIGGEFKVKVICYKLKIIIHVSGERYGGMNCKRRIQGKGYIL